VQVDQHITLNEDGSGRLDVRYAMSLENMRQMEAMARQAGGAEGEGDSAAPFDFNEEQIRKEFADYGAHGVTLESVTSEEKDGWKHIRIGVLFKDLAGLAKTELVADRALSLVKDQRGNYAFRQAAGERLLPGATGGGSEQQNASELLAGLLKGFRARVRMTVPRPIVESNAEKVDGRTALWEFDLEKDPRAIERLQKADMRVVFEGAGLELPELKPSAEK
jgi:hypothetical protein